MADNIIQISQFQKMTELVLGCDCGCQLFYVLDTYRYRCYGCNAIWLSDEEMEDDE